jgi:dihydropteroate synthase
MGILNVTPDSFSDGGCFLDPDTAVAHGQRMADEGASLIDVGGESTRPGAAEVESDEEIRRVVPVVEALAGEVRVSIDTTKPEVARAAVEVGASLINDVSASLWPVAADLGVGWIAMHMRGTPRTMQDAPTYDDVVGEVRDFLVERADRARDAGVDEIWIDPGIGFGKTMAHNLSLLHHVDELVATGYPVAIGTSRKSMLGRLLAASDGVDEVPTHDRLEGSLASATWAMAQGVRMIRAHDVLPTVQAALVVGGQEGRTW